MQPVSSRRRVSWFDSLAVPSRSIRAGPVVRFCQDAKAAQLAVAEALTVLQAKRLAGRWGPSWKGVVPRPELDLSHFLGLGRILGWYGGVWPVWWYINQVWVHFWTVRSGSEREGSTAEPLRKLQNMFRQLGQNQKTCIVFFAGGGEGVWDVSGLWVAFGDGSL